MEKLILVVTLIGLTVLSACKKDQPVVAPPMAVLNIAPCTLNDTIYQMDSVFHGNSTVFPNAPFSVKFIDTTNGSMYPEFKEFAFNKIPTSGMYSLVPPSVLGNPAAGENQITYLAEQGNFQFLAYGTYDNFGSYDDVIYVENNQNELIISYCEMIAFGFTFEPSCNCYVGNGPGYMKYTKAY
jgi:hypothetical protein